MHAQISYLRSQFQSKLMTPLRKLTATGRQLIESVYHATIRDRLPRRPMVVKSEPITIKRPRVFDMGTMVGSHEPEEYESLRALIRTGDHVVIIGGGYGSSTVLASRLAGSAGRVDVWEAVPAMADLTTWAVENNLTEAPVYIHNEAVETLTATSEESYGKAVSTVSVDEVPTGDVWSLDCEGAEAAILSAGDPPDRLSVEVHPGMADMSKIANLLERAERINLDVSDDIWIAVIGGNL